MSKIIAYNARQVTKSDGTTYFQQDAEIVQTPHAPNERIPLFFETEAQCLPRGIVHDADAIYSTDYKTRRLRVRFTNFKKAA